MTLKLTEKDIEDLKQIVINSEKLPVLQFAYFIGAVNARFGEETGAFICKAVKKGQKVNVDQLTVSEESTLG